MGKPDLEAEQALLTPCEGASFALHGAGASAGIAIGHAHLVTSARMEAPRYEIDAADIDAELTRFDRAIRQVREELLSLHKAVPDNAPPEMAAFLDLHRMVLDDSMLSQTPRELIRSKRYNAEWALIQQTEALVQRFEEVEDAYLRERGADVQQVAERILKALMGSRHAPPLAGEAGEIIVVAHDFSPADMILFRQHNFAGFVTDLGGVTSHTAIVARSLNLPAVVGMHHARQMVREHELLIVDGAAGVLIVNPDPQVLGEYRLRQRAFELERQKLRRLRRTPASTLEGVAVELHANIELPQDVKEALGVGAAGVGLFRSEFLFLNRDDFPSEDEQFEAYRSVISAMRGLPVTIRTLDIGADKTLDGHHSGGPNPALGLRAIRYCLAEPQMFMTQLRAILRASHYGKVRILLPMIGHFHEVEQAAQILAQARRSLAEQGIPFDPAIPVGGMIEVPAAALAAAQFVKRLDFLSIGTNDLIQYTLAIDRTDDKVAHLYDPLHPAVLQLIAQTIRTGARAGVPVAVCGEMAGEVVYARLLLGLGLRQFSMHPSQLPAVKQQILRSSVPVAETLAQRIIKSDDPEKSRQLLARLNA
ncbi:MAG TPA: phosphoenolpyruvate--protein phosphotransferase [Burkholderiales bacterium]|nr:phosphoenolpyruvate--protein phosphotransferase [Burkholderiales bacterium]